MAVTRVDYIHKRTIRIVALMILLVWTASVIISLLPLLGWKDSDFNDRVNLQKQCMVRDNVQFRMQICTRGSAVKDFFFLPKPVTKSALTSPGDFEQIRMQISK